MYPSELKYTDTHEWVRDEGDGIVSVGITAFAVNELSDIVFMELPSAGGRVKKGSPFGAVESVKAVFDLNSPVSGEVVDVNGSLVEDAEVLKSDPYKEGWMIKVKLDEPGELEGLLDEKSYSEQAK